ncbi:hypothetical protein [Yinghuangia sp. YIM S09857]|uniref:hypothetical protein n=1 Tax=Yinghuangia sp. YIM S09857 TaxID=3436929 RepID=UPI003F530540
MPFALGAVRVDMMCGPGPTGRWQCRLAIRVPAALLRPQGLHPDQPSSRPAATGPPGWWHAEAERRARRGVLCGVPDALSSPGTARSGPGTLD